MKIIVQRVIKAQVYIENELFSQINKGYLLYVCLENQDTPLTIEKAATKISKLRIFTDDKDLMNLNIHQVKGEILSISQFTLSWTGQKGHRPSFEGSMSPSKAKLYYANFNRKLEELGCHIKTGRFGADMKVQSINDGPVTFHFDF